MEQNNLVLTAGLALVVSNGVASGEFKQMWAQFNPNEKVPIDSSTVSPHFILMTTIAQIVMIWGLSLIAEINPMAETIVFTIIVGLWLAFIVLSGSAFTDALKWKA